MTEPVPEARFSIETPATPGAIGVIALHSEDLDAALARLGIGAVGVGQVALRDLLGVDRGLVARWSETRADLMAHGGIGVMRRLRSELIEHGCREGMPDPRQRYPEAQSEVEARMLEAMAGAASERAIDLLLAQPGRWAGVPEDAPDESLVPGDHLGRLLTPALVVVAGRANIGKSTLVNALSGRGVSVVADEAGTTRDHVGVMLELDGLVVRCLDLPGLVAGGRAPDARAQELALEMACAADLALLCGDSAQEPPTPEEIGVPASRSLRLGLRSDLGEPAWGAEHTVCAPEGRGVSALARLVRQRLVPDAALNDPRPWRFWVDDPG